MHSGTHSLTSRRRWSRAALAVVVATALLAPGVSLGAPAAADVGAAKLLYPEFPPDSFEVDDWSDLAKPIAVNSSPQARTLHDFMDEDWARFSAKKGGVYVISAGTGLEPNDAAALASVQIDAVPEASVYLSLYGPNGRSLLTESSGEMRFTMEGQRPPAQVVAAGIGVEASSLVWEATEDSTLYVRARCADSRSVGRYFLAVDKRIPSISGYVGTADTREPAWWTTVDARSGDMSGPAAQIPSGFTAYPNMAGRYYFFDLPAGDYRVGFEPWYESYHSEYYDDARVPEDADPVVVTGLGSSVRGIDARLEPREASIGGVVTDQDDRRIGWDIYVSLYQWDGFQYTWYTSTWTDGDSRYGFYDLPDGEYVVQFDTSYRWDWYGEMYDGEWWDDAPDVGSADALMVIDGIGSASAHASLTRLYAFAGRVVDESGDPIEGIEVQSFYDGDSDPSYYAYTNEDGRYWVYGPGDASTVNLRFVDWSYGFFGEWYDDVAVQDDAADLGVDYASPVAGMDATLAATPPSLAGTVTDRGTGSPLEGIEVWLFRPTPGGTFPVDATVTEADGGYAFHGGWDQERYVRFVDPSMRYANEYFDNAPVIGMAEAVWTGPSPGDTEIVSAELTPKTARVAGATRFDTAVRMAEEAYPGWAGVGRVIVASGDSRFAADPLTASSLCWAYDAPLLLTAAGGTPPALATALGEIVAASDGPVQVIVVGGTAAVPDARLAEIEAIVGGGNVERLAGATRYHTAAAIAERTVSVAEGDGRVLPGRVLIANGADRARFFDALALSPVAASSGAPILLVGRDFVPAPTADALADLGPSQVIVAGGIAAVSPAVYARVGGTRRLAGPDRFATAAAVADHSVVSGWLGPMQVGISATLPDALSGGAMMGRMNGALLLTRRDVLPGPTWAYLEAHDQDIVAARVFGGPLAVSEGVRDAITLALEH